MRCLNCFKEYDESFGICPHCGSYEYEKRNPNDLNPGTIINNRYLIGQSIGSGGFGIIYKAWDNRLQSIVAIKEFFPEKIANRDTDSDNLIVTDKDREEYNYRKTRFIAEDKITAEFRVHKNIVTEYECFEYNNTVYMVMEYLVGDSLSDLLESGVRYSEKDAIKIITEVGKALSAIHNIGIIHRDVSPDNIFIITEPEFRVILLDFGAAKLVNYSSPVTDILLKKGYSSLEQYKDIEDASTASDVYSLAATLYKILTNENPVDALVRSEKDDLKNPRYYNSQISLNVSKSIMRGMAVDYRERIQTVSDFISDLKNGVAATKSVGKEDIVDLVEDGQEKKKSSPKKQNKKEKSEKKSTKKKPLIAVLVTLIIIAVLAGSGLLFYHFYYYPKYIHIPDGIYSSEEITGVRLIINKETLDSSVVISKSEYQVAYIDIQSTQNRSYDVQVRNEDEMVVQKCPNVFPGVFGNNARIDLSSLEPGLYHLIIRETGTNYGDIYFRVVE